MAFFVPTVLGSQGIVVKYMAVLGSQGIVVECMAIFVPVGCVRFARYCGRMYGYLVPTVC